MRLTLYPFWIHHEWIAPRSWNPSSERSTAKPGAPWLVRVEFGIVWADVLPRPLTGHEDVWRRYARPPRRQLRMPLLLECVGRPSGRGGELVHGRGRLLGLLGGALRPGREPGLHHLGGRTDVRLQLLQQQPRLDSYCAVSHVVASFPAPPSASRTPAGRTPASFASTSTRTPSAGCPGPSC